MVKKNDENLTTTYKAYGGFLFSGVLIICDKIRGGSKKQSFKEREVTDFDPPFPHLLTTFSFPTQYLGEGS